MRNLPDAPESRSQPQILNVSHMEMAHELVPGLESLPEIPGNQRRIKPILGELPDQGNSKGSGNAILK